MNLAGKHILQMYVLRPTVVDLPNIHRESELAGTLAASADPDPGHLEFSEGLE